MVNDTNHEKIYPRPLSGALVKNFPRTLVPGKLPLTGKYVTLEPQDADAHAAELYDAGHSTAHALHIWDYLAYGPWPDLNSYKETLRAQSSSLDPIFYSIRSVESGKACGQASFLDISEQNGVIEIGHIWFGPELQKTRGGTEALFLMLCYALDDLKYRRMQWRCNSLNESSRQAARRLGFRFEGIFHNHLIFKGKNRDTAWYSILDDEWPEVREKISIWLKDSNFTKELVPKSSLSQVMNERTKSTRNIVQALE